MNISLDGIITDDNDTEDIISESQPHDYTSDNIINYLVLCICHYIVVKTN